MWHIMLTLAAVPLYRCRYAETVIHRIFYYNNRLGDGQMSWREFRRCAEPALALR